MSNLRSVSDSLLDKVLDECEKVRTEVFFRASDDGDIDSLYQSYLLCYEPGERRILIHIPEGTAHMPFLANETIDLTIQLANVVYALEVKYIGEWRSVEIGKSSLRTFAVTLTNHCYRMQRREHFRINMAGSGGYAAKLSTMIEDDAIEVEGMIFDLSAGGVAIRLDPGAMDDLALFEVGADASVIFTVNHSEGPIALDSKVSQVRTVNGRHALIALQFDDETPSVVQSRNLSRVGSFVAWYDRERRTRFQNERKRRAV
ncbi:MAG: PilZ domain-containing protein [Planctomycetes bacterium]|nr:PilZ domain-containing protein [Planctomycetota bacterium]